MTELLKKIADIVRDASRIMTDNEKRARITQKGNASNYVTEADTGIQQYLSQRLPSLIPGSTIVGEEDGQLDASGRYIWVIDPIDGTSNFIRDLGLSVISVGLIHDGKPYIGVIYHPYMDEMYCGEVGLGAFLNDKPIHVSDRDFAHSHLCSAMSLYDKRYAKPCFNIIEKVYSQSDDLRRLGSAALELALLAAGKVELYFEMRVFAWDVAAAFAMIIAAGGYIECLHEDGLPLDRPFPIIAANTEENFKKLKEIVVSEVPQTPYSERI
ncbi:MAG: inositol monophosphatase [Lachnospiraceae bacterium]|nr:inositol monophosphatase [Lachnospiraceae bacterium]